MKQHFVPQCYLKAWCDTATPSGYEPYVWKFSKDGKTVKKTSPRKIFRETHMYSIEMPNGSKDLRLEKGLHELEDQFVRIRDALLVKKADLNKEDNILLLAFVAAMHNRTRVQRDHQREQWGNVAEKMRRMKVWAETATPEQLRAASSLSSGDEKGFSFEEVEKLAANPLQNMLVPMIQTEVPLLYGTDMAILQTDSEPGFITSDSPCVWFDPKWHTRPPMYQAPALAYPTIEITMPVSPTQLIFLNRAGLTGYIDIGENVVDNLNRRIRFNCDEYFIVNQKIIREKWFDRGVATTPSSFADNYI